MTEVLLTKEFLEEKVAAGHLLLLEDHLDKLPLDWMDCVMVVSTQGLDPHARERHLVTIDDDQSPKVFEAIAKEEIPVLIFADNKKRVWNVLMTKVKNKETGADERAFIGGENLRKFCDERNIAYRSFIVANGDLMSGTTMMWEKHPDEDCRKPVDTTELAS